MRALTLLASVLVAAIVLLIGAAADMDTGQRTAYALGICSATIAFVVADWLMHKFSNSG